MYFCMFIEMSVKCFLDNNVGMECLLYELFVWNEIFIIFFYIY